MNEAWLAHHGIKNQKWGIRRFQNPDGSLTSAGKQRYGVGSIRKDGYQENKKPFGSRIDGYQKQSKPGKPKYKIGDKMNDNDPNDSSITRRAKKEYNNLSDDEFKRKYQVSKNIYRKRVNKYGDPYMNSPLAKAGKSLSKRKGKNPDKVAEDELNGSVATPKMSEKTKKALKTAAKIGAAAALAGLAAYGAYKSSDYIKTEAGRKIRKEGEHAAYKMFERSNEELSIFYRLMETSIAPEMSLETGQKIRSLANEHNRAYRDIRQEGMQIYSDYEDRARNISTINAAKYLLEQKKKKRS